jgi:hypothetical protein
MRPEPNTILVAPSRCASSRRIHSKMKEYMMASTKMSNNTNSRTTTDDAQDVLVKCDIRGCRSSSAPLFGCSFPSCTKQVHDVCYRVVIEMKHNLDGLVGTTGSGGEELRVCTKKCYMALQRAMSGSEQRILWTRDGRNGPTDPVNSMSVLIDWLATDGNFSRFRGNNGGETKLAICQEIADLMKEKGIVAERTGKLILDKIAVIEKSFKVAHDWINQQGQGMLASNEQFEQAVTKRCPYYYELEQIMGDRVTAKNCALGTNADLQSSEQDGKRNNSSDDEENNDYDDAEAEEGDEEGNAGDSSANEDKVDDENKSTPAASTRSRSSVLFSMQKGTRRSRGLSPGVSSSSSKKSKNSPHIPVLQILADANLIALMQAIKRDLLQNRQDKWSNKTQEMEYKMKCIKNAAKLKKLGWSNSKVLKSFPDFAPFLSSDDQSNSDGSDAHEEY